MYITLPCKQKSAQITFEDLLFGRTTFFNTDRSVNDTRTFFKKYPPKKLLDLVDVETIIESLRVFNENYKNMIAMSDKSTLYRSYKIPKRSGGLRKIDEPEEELMQALRELKFILETKFYAKHHTCAYAYVKERCAVDAVKKHQANKSRWFLKLDFHNFFGSTTEKFLFDQLSCIFPFSEVIKNPDGKNELKKSLSLCFLNGGLPQGTPISPMLTNLMMIPVDYQINKFAQNAPYHLCYTRYADDILISCKYGFEYKEVVKAIEDILHNFSAPFYFNKKKTRYASSAGRNWNLGVMLNVENKITIGHVKRKAFKVKLYCLLKDYTTGTPWCIDDVREFQGVMSYYLSVERENIEKIIKSYEDKFSLNVKEVFKELLLAQ